MFLEFRDAATGIKSRYRWKRLCSGRVKKGLGDAVQPEGRFGEQNGSVKQTGRERGPCSGQLFPVLVSAVVAGRAMLVFRVVLRAMLMPALAIRAVIMQDSFGLALMMYHSIAQHPEHRLR